MTLTTQKNPSIGDDSPPPVPLNAESHNLRDTLTEIGVGMDVHKDSIVVCVSGRLPNGEIIILRDHSFRNDYRGVKELCKFLTRYAKIATFLMECTGVYHVALYRALQESFPKRMNYIIAMNPLLIHNRICDLGSKTDKADARSLSSLALYRKILRPSYVGSADFFAIRDLMRSYHRNNTQTTRLKNRIHRQLHLANLKFSFDLKTEWGLHLLDHYISQAWTFGECYYNYLSELKENGKGRVLERKWEDVIPNEDVKLTDPQRFILQVDLIRLLNSQQASAIFLNEAEIHILHNPGLKKHYEHMCIIPGFSSPTILTVLTEVGDYSRFRNANAFSKFCGVVPTIQQSGAHTAKGHVNRFTNKHLRFALTQAAAVIISRPNRNTDIGAFAYKQYHLRHLPFKKAMLKVAQKYARILYGIFTEIRVYEPYFENKRKKSERLARRLEKQGTLIESYRTRALKRNISHFLVANSKLLNSTSKYHLVNGFHRLIRKSKYLDQEKEQSKKK